MVEGLAVSRRRPLPAPDHPDRPGLGLGPQGRPRGPDPAGALGRGCFLPDADNARLAWYRPRTRGATSSWSIGPAAGSRPHSSGRGPRGDRRVPGGLPAGHRVAATAGPGGRRGRRPGRDGLRLEPRRGAPPGSFSGHTRPITAVSFSGDGTVVAHGERRWDGQAWNLAVAADAPEADQPVQVIQAPSRDPSATARQITAATDQSGQPPLGRHGALGLRPVWTGLPLGLPARPAAAAADPG